MRRNARYEEAISRWVQEKQVMESRRHGEGDFASAGGGRGDGRGAEIQAPVTLKEAYQGTFAIGAAVNAALHVEADSGLNPYPSRLPDALQEQLAKRFGELFVVFLRHRDVVRRVTLWGVTDEDSWRNEWRVRGRTNDPLLFDRSGQPKLAFDAVIRAASN